MKIVEMILENRREDLIYYEECLPTTVVSVSSMRPCGWREMVSVSTHLVPVPTEW